MIFPPRGNPGCPRANYRCGPAHCTSMHSKLLNTASAWRGNTIRKEGMERGNFSTVSHRSLASKALHRAGTCILSALFYSLVMVSGKEESEHFKHK